MPAPALTRRARAGLLVVGVALGASLGGGAGAAAQVPGTTAPDVLVPGDPTATTAPATTAPGSTTTAPAASEDDGLLDLDANEKVWIIVAALVVVAILLLVLTIIYWRHTKPEGEDDGDRPSRRERRRARRAAKADSAQPPEEEAGPDPGRDGPMDLDGLLGSPEPDRSVFGGPDQPAERSR